MKIGTICSGIGAPEKALKKLGIKFDLAYFCEVDKYAAKAYEAIHKVSANNNIGDLTDYKKCDLPSDLDLLIGGTPCQDFSVAGKNRGGDLNSGTRSSLLWYFLELIKDTKPKTVVWENVTGVLQKAHLHNYFAFVECLGKIGYIVYAKCLNAKLFGIPQNRDRVFVVAIRRDLDIPFSFPIGEDRGRRLKHLVDIDVDAKYFLSNVAVDGFINHNNKYQSEKLGFLWRPLITDQIARTILARSSLGASDNVIMVTLPHGFNKGKIHTEFVSSVTSSQWQYNNIVLFADGVYLHQSKNFFRGTLQGFSRTLTTGATDAGVIINNVAVRRFTPLETTRLFGFDDNDYYVRRAAGISESQIYKQNGNSIVVNVLMAIFGELYGIPWREKVYGDFQQNWDDLPLLQYGR